MHMQHAGNITNDVFASIESHWSTIHMRAPHTVCMCIVRSSNAQKNILNEIVSVGNAGKEKSRQLTVRDETSKLYTHLLWE